MSIIPSKIRIQSWIENYDLRRLRRDAIKLCKEYRLLKPGDTAIVSGSKYNKARRFCFLIQATGGPLVAAPQTSERELMLGLMLRVSRFTHDNFDLEV